MQHYDVITNPRWQTTANMKIVMSAYLSDTWSDYDEIYFTDSDSDYNKHDLIEIQILHSRWRKDAISENIILDYNWAADCPIFTKFWTKSDSILTVECENFQNFELQDDGRNCYIAGNFVGRCKIRAQWL